MVGGQLMRKCTSVAPAWRTMRTIFRLVVPRMIESSINQDDPPPLQQIVHWVQLSFTPKSRTRLFRLDNVRPT